MASFKGSILSAIGAHKYCFPAVSAFFRGIGSPLSFDMQPGRTKDKELKSVFRGLNHICFFVWRSQPGQICKDFLYGRRTPGCPRGRRAMTAWAYFLIFTKSEGVWRPTESQMLYSPDFSSLSQTGSPNPSSFIRSSCVFASPTTSQYILPESMYFFESSLIFSTVIPRTTDSLRFT